MPASFLGVQVLPAQNECGPFFTLSTGGEVTACDVPTLGNPTPEFFCPCHAHCIKIVELVADARSRCDNALSHIYNVLKGQLAEHVERNHKMQPVTNLMNAGKYGTLWQYQELEWHTSDEEAEVYEADPINILNLTSSLLAHLSTLPAPDLPSSSQSTTDGASCSATEEPKAASSYPQTLFQHPILPWIWDFNTPLTSEQRTGNWDLLIKQISSIEIIEPGNVIADLPPGLRNQRRIWALVDDLLDTEVKEGMEVSGSL